MSALLDIDIVLFTLVNGLHSIPADFFFLAVTQLGSGWVVSPLLLLAMVRTFRGRNLARVVIISFVALTVSGLMNSGIKSAVGRPRPVGYFSLSGPRSSGDPVIPVVHTVGERHRHRSFPSGHTNTAFAVATLCVVLLGRRFRATYIPAALVGYSRVYLGLHFPLDVICGALLGAGVAGAVAVGGRRMLLMSRSEKESDYHA